MAKPNKKTSTKPKDVTAKGTFSVALLKLNSDHEFFYGIRFPTVEGTLHNHIVPRGGTSKVGAIVDDLMRKGAVFDDRKTAGKLIEQLFAEADEKGVLGDLVRRNGWQGDAFVEFNSDVKVHRIEGKSRRLWVQPLQAPTYLGVSKGDITSWQQDVAVPAQASTLAMYAISVALAAPLARHAGLAEGVIFNIAGLSSTGKTTVAKIAASVSGDPEKIPDWNFTDTAVEELAAAHSDHLMILDDTERAREDPAKRLKPVAHVLAGGQSRKRSTAVSARFAQSDWFLMMLMTSPQPILELVKAGGMEHTLGEKVRLIDLCVPNDGNGVFDRCDDEISPAAQADLLQQGISENYGTLFKAWMPELPRLIEHVKTDLDRTIEKREQQAGRSFAGHERRILRKLFLPLIAAKEAKNVGLLPWKPEDIKAMEQNVVKPALKYFRRSQNSTQQAWKEFAKRLQARDGLFDLRHTDVMDRALRSELASKADIGLLVTAKSGDDLIGISKSWVDRLGTRSDNPILSMAQKLQKKPNAKWTQLAKQKRVKLNDGAEDRPRLVYLPIHALEDLVQLNAGDGYEKWELED